MVVGVSVFRLGECQPDGRVDPFERDPDLGAGRSRASPPSSCAVFACGRRFLQRRMRRACRPTSPMRAPPIRSDVLGGRGGQHAGAGRRRLPGQHLVRRPQDFRYAGRRREIRLGRPRHDDDQRDRRRRRLVLAGYLEWTDVIAAWTHVVAARRGRRARRCAGRRALGARRFPTFQSATRCWRPPAVLVAARSSWASLPSVR